MKILHTEHMENFISLYLSFFTVNEVQNKVLWPKHYGVWPKQFGFQGTKKVGHPCSRYSDFI